MSTYSFKDFQLTPFPIISFVMVILETRQLVSSISHHIY